MKKTNKSPVICDLFAGCGGLTLGFLQAGFTVGWANEINRDAASTYASCHPGAKVFNEPVEVFYNKIATKEEGYPKKGDVDVVVGGPPCQGFSGYNPRRRVDDPRNSLVETFLDIVSELHPRVVLIENVPGMLGYLNGQTPKAILSALEDIGYCSKLGILQGGHYGLPQNRWRVFIVAALKGMALPAFPIPTHKFIRTTIFGATEFRANVIKPELENTLFDNLLPMTTVEDAIKDLPLLDNGGSPKGKLPYSMKPHSDFAQALRNNSNLVGNNGCKKLDELNLSRCQALPKNAPVGWLDLPEDLKPANLLRHGDSRYENRFGRLQWEKTFNTILTRAHPYWGRIFHPEQDRVISVRESARAQGFPDDVEFSGGMSSQYMQVGNAVPPVLAKAIADKILEVF